MSIRFISDLHLDEKSPAICRAFFRYLDELPKDTEALYILGDFFEVWIGDDDDLPFHLDIMKKLKEKTASGLPIYLMHGNRDFLVGKYFELHTGCFLIKDPLTIVYHDETYLLMHGDSLCIEDTEYQAFRQHIRKPETQSDILKQTLEQRREFAQNLRTKSKTANSVKSLVYMDVSQSEVEKVMLQHNVQTLIHGHTHLPAIHTFQLDGKAAKRIVLGDWHDNGWEICIDGSEVKLREFPLLV